MDTRARKILIGALCALLVLIGGVLIASMRNAGNVDALEKTTEKVMPPDTTMSFMAPATKDWWRFVQEMADTTNEVRDFPFPEGAKWIGYSEGLDAGGKDMMTVHYVGFDSVKAAEKYVRGKDYVPTRSWVRAYGTVVEFLPVSHEFDREKFPKPVQSLEKVPSKAVWKIDLTDHFTSVEAVSVWDKTREFFTATGLRGSDKERAVWTGTSGSPADSFEGKVENGKKPNIKEMSYYSMQSATLACDGNTCVEQIPGLNVLGYSGAFTVQMGEKAFGTRFGDLPKQSFKPSKGESVGFINWYAIRGNVMGSDSGFDTDMPGFDFKFNGKDLTLQPVWKSKNKD